MFSKAIVFIVQTKDKFILTFVLVQKILILFLYFQDSILCTLINCSGICFLFSELYMTSIIKAICLSYVEEVIVVFMDI